MNAQILNINDFNIQPKHKRRADWNEHHQLILNEIVEHFKEHKTLPTNKQLSKTLKLSPQAIGKHRQNLTFEILRPEYKELTVKVMLCLFAKCLTGSVPAVKLWMQIVEGWTERMTKEVVIRDQMQAFFGEYHSYFDMNEEQIKEEIKKITDKISQDVNESL